MAQKKMTAKQRQEQAAKQRKTEIIVICCVAAALILGIILLVLLGGTATSVNTTSGDVSNTHVHDESCSHDTTELKKNGDGATLETAVATHIATITIKDYGTVKAELYGNTAPVSVNNFVDLAQQGFYDGLTFHRIINGFMMQGGAGNSESASVEAIEGEFSANGIENNLLHKKGVLSMARTNVMNSATSQFFIMHEDDPSLDGQYAAFGMVIEGQDIVDEICEQFPSVDSTIATEDQPVIESITVEKVS